MKTKASLLILTLFLTISSCSKKVDFTPEFIKQTSGRYLYNQDEIIDVYYEKNHLFIEWKNVKAEPVILDDNIFFLADMYKKLHFNQHPETKERYLSILPENDNDPITYDYLKVDKNYKTPSMLLKNKEYDKALEVFLTMKTKDSIALSYSEGEFNSLGYQHLRKKEYKDAIEVFKMNVVLFPESDNVYDSLAEGYLLSGDSLQAYNNYKKAYEHNTGNTRAKKYVEAFDNK